MKSSLSVIAAMSATALMTACGGDGGDNAAVDNKVAVTSANQSAVVRASLSGGVSIALAQGSFDGGTTLSAASVGDVLQRAIAATRGQRRGIQAAGAHPAAVSTSSDACDVSGTVSSTFDDRDGDGKLSKGDVLTATFAQCKYTSTYSINGALTITLGATPDASSIDGAAAFQNVVVVSGGVTSTVGGNVNVHEVDTSTSSLVTLTAGSGGLQVGVASSSYNDTVTFQSGFVIADTETEGSAAQSSVTLAGTLTASSIGGDVTIATPTPLVTASSDFYPKSGVVKVTGANGSAVLATALNNAQVQLQLDANGDGTYESTSTVTWVSLIPQ